MPTMMGRIDMRFLHPCTVNHRHRTGCVPHRAARPRAAADPARGRAARCGTQPVLWRWLTVHGWRKRMSIRPIIVGILSLVGAACSQLPSTDSVAVPPIPAGEARVWFYRQADPYDSIGTPYIRMNEAIVGLSMPGGASYHDVPAGPYHI